MKKRTCGEWPANTRTWQGKTSNYDGSLHHCKCCPGVVPNVFGCQFIFTTCVSNTDIFEWTTWIPSSFETGSPKYLHVWWHSICLALPFTRACEVNLRFLLHFIRSLSLSLSPPPSLHRCQVTPSCARKRETSIHAYFLFLSLSLSLVYDFASLTWFLGQNFWEI